MKIAFALVFVFVLAACSGNPPAPTVDVSAVRTEAAQAVFATQTASVPTLTNTPEATATPKATVTPQPTNTPKPTVTPTSIPTETPLPAVEIPDGWTPYTAVTERFSLAYPSNWTVSDEQPTVVSFRPTLFSALVVGYDGFAFSDSPENEVDSWFEHVAKDERNSITNPKKGIWDDGVHKGVFAEYASYDSIYDQWGYNIKIGMPSNHGTMAVSYFRTLTKSESDDVRDVLRKLSATIRESDKSN